MLPCIEAIVLNVKPCWWKFKENQCLAYYIFGKLRFSLALKAYVTCHTLGWKIIWHRFQTQSFANLHLSYTCIFCENKKSLVIIIEPIKLQISTFCHFCHHNREFDVVLMHNMRIMCLQLVLFKFLRAENTRL